MTPTGRSALAEVQLTATTSPDVIGPPTDADRERLQDTYPSMLLQPREVISAVMMAIHRSSWDSPRPYFGFEVLGRFLSPTHQYERAIQTFSRTATPQSLSRYLQQPHKASLLAWNEYRWEGDLTLMGESAEAYQQISVRSGPNAPWTSVRWMLVRVEPSSDPHSQWMVDAVFVSEPDNSPGVSEAMPPTIATSTDDDAEAAWAAGPEAWAMLASPLDAPLTPEEQRRLFDAFDMDGGGTISRQEFRQVVEDLGLPIPSSELSQLMRDADVDQSGDIGYEEFSLLLGKAVEGSATVAGRFASEATKAAKEMFTDSPRQVVESVMKALRNVDEPYPLHGAEVAVRFCSPTNKASQLSPQAFATYLNEPWYAILTEWDEMQIDEDDEEEDVEAALARRWDELRLNVAEVGTLVRRKGEPWTVVNWELSRHNGRWLTDSLDITG
uniref:EF-hand domain-containing protein n=1 Tax=Haptolina brevifila TaxID=156173 RepID=A0A7S2NRG0_9EUKA